MDSLCKPSSTYEEANHHHEVRKTSFLRHFYAKTRTFTKTGSGQTKGKLKQGTVSRR
jgi:hypothetical protein